MAQETGPKDSTGNGAAPAVAVNPPGGPPRRPAARTASAPPTPPKRNAGRRRDDGLTPGSPEAIEADKKKDRERKQQERALAEPAALPPAGATNGDSASAPLNGAGPGSPAPDAPEANAVPWDPATLRPLFEELIEGAEESRVNKLRSLAVKAALPDKLVSEIARDAKYSPTCKRTMIVTAPNVVAKAMNRTGISGKYSDEAILITALIGNFVQGRRLQSKLKKFIEAQNKPTEEKKP